MYSKYYLFVGIYSLFTTTLDSRNFFLSQLQLKNSNLRVIKIINKKYLKQNSRWNNIKRRTVYRYIVSLNRITKPRKNSMNVIKKSKQKSKSYSKMLNEYNE